MGDFFNAAFPWIAIGVAVAIILTYMDSKKKKHEDKKR
jgi:lipoprotein signal peptidase